jgi:translation initiation factor 3 subunit F
VALFTWNDQILIHTVDTLASSASKPAPAAQPPLAVLSSSLNQLSSLLDQSLSYVQSVQSGSAKADPEVGRYLLEGVGRWSGEGTEDEKGVKEGLQDTLTVAYLANLLRSQIELAGRLTLLQQAQAAPQQ